MGNEPLDIACKCGAAFCFQCTEEAHRPVSIKPYLPLLCNHLRKGLEDGRNVYVGRADCSNEYASPSLPLDVPDLLSLNTACCGMAGC